MKSEAKISVIVPVYKVEPYLRRCVDSILAQTFGDFALILVDDGSPDNCGAICDEYAALDERVTVIHKQNGGLSSARNAGIDMVFDTGAGEWITFIDSDDWVHPKYFEGLINAAEKYDADISVCGFLEAHGLEPFKSIAEFDVCRVETEEFYVHYNTIATVAWGKIYKKRFFEKIRYPVGRLHEDEFVTYRLLFKISAIAYVKNEMYFYFQNPAGITRVQWTPKRLDALDALDGQFDFFCASPYRDAFDWIGEVYKWRLVEGYDNLQGYEDFENKELYLEKIRKRVKKCLRKHKIDKAKMNKYLYERLYSIAHPFGYKIYLFKKRVKKKINRIKNRS